MKFTVRMTLAFLVALVGAQAAVPAHFKLVEPASWIVEDQRGNPQKGRSVRWQQHELGQALVRGY